MLRDVYRAFVYFISSTLSFSCKAFTFLNSMWPIWIIMYRLEA
jgi:hypothetical protein